MSLMAKVLRLLAVRTQLIGPGRLLLVVGPSGAGKDTLIARARAACRDDATVVFPRRIVTRPASAFEDNEVMAQQAFEQAAARGAFAFWWSAHGHSYGIPLAVDFDIEAGRTVVCNVSRTVVGAVRARYAHVVAVLVTAPRETLAVRLAARARPSDGSIEQRVGRSEIDAGGFRPDVIINNVGDPDIGARKLVDTVYASGVFVA
jgi:ribose 1,5-bisphosphokinase